MAILDKLMEKKDLIIYIKARKAEVSRIAYEQIPKLPPKDREKFRQRQKGRQMELDYLREVMAQDALKERTLESWARNWQKVKKNPQSKACELEEE